jgi:hypothetical protein
MYLDWQIEIEEILKQGLELGLYDKKSLFLIASIMISLMDGAMMQYLTRSSQLDIDTYFIPI